MARPPSTSARTKALDATATLALQHGLDRVSFEEVARRSGVAKTTLYRHFGSRPNLLIAALNRLVEPPTAPDTGSLIGDLQAFLGSVRPLFADPDIRTLSLEIMAAGTRDEELDELRQRFFAGRMGPLWSVVERAQDRGELGPDLDLISAVEIIEGPFIIWSMIAPDRIMAADLVPLADQVAHQLVAAAPGPATPGPAAP